MIVEEKAVYQGKTLYIVNQDWVVVNGYTPEDEILKPVKLDDVWVFPDFGFFGAMLAKGENDEIVISYREIKDE